MASAVVAPCQQGPQDPPRSDYVFHIYVGPLFGDDARATALNPSTSPTGVQLRPLDRHPQPPDANNIKPITGFLQHAPYPFKTLTGAQGALKWVDTNFRAGTPPFFPWTNPTTDRKVTHVVVHCLPGLYGPAPIPGGPGPLDAESGLPWNGETWPAILRERVSIQGVSALDTIFDARQQPVSIIEVVEDVDIPGSNITHAQSFIDAVMIRGARNDGGSADAPGAGAGIWIHQRLTGSINVASQVTISNCVITDNVVGVAIDGWWGFPTSPSSQVPRIINNTFAWNACGVWAGNRVVAANPSAHIPVLINNIFDSGSPPGYLTGISGFEGIAAGDLQVHLVGVLATPINGATGIDFNAWEVNVPPAPPHVNRGIAITSQWIATAPNNLWQFTGPRVDIAPYTGKTSGIRGALYLNDVFRHSPEGGTGSEYSRHDFRLAPNISASAAPPLARNPLVDQGIDDELGPVPDGLYPLVMRNAQRLDHRPGLPDGVESTEISAWDWDGEGFGNPRIHDRALITNGTWAGYESKIDLGFDEMGDLIMAGYLANTRSFVKLSVPQGGVTLPDRGRVFYFNFMAGGAPPPPASYPRPLANAPFGTGEGWYQHVQAGTDLEDLNYTKLQTLASGSLRRLATQVAGHFSSIPRALRCDYSPSLLLDPHSEWGRLIKTGALPEDPYAANPWHDDPTTLGLKSLNNPALFHNLGGTIHNDVAPPETKGLFGLKATGVSDATLNPPGTSVFTGIAYVIPPTAVFGPWTPCSGAPGAPYTIGTWGYGDGQAGCPDVIPYFGSSSDFIGIRYNCQIGVAESNLQTFLAIRDPEGAEASAAAGNLERLPRRPTLEELLDLNTRASIEIERRWRESQSKR